MAQLPNPFGLNRPSALDYSAPESRAISTFFNSVYAWMSAGLALTATVAILVSQYLMKLFAAGDIAALRQFGGICIGLFIAQIVLVMVISAATQRISAGVATHFLEVDRAQPADIGCQLVEPTAEA